LCITGNVVAFTATAAMKWLRDQDIEPACIQPDSPWQNSFAESVNGKLRNECLKREWYVTRKAAKSVIEKWRQFYNNERAHSAPGHRTPTQAGQQRRQTQSV